jgi:hypothetical protein
VRYNLLIDIFLGLTTYSLQNHLRTHVQGMGQIEIDEIYVGLNRNGAQYVIPVQAKGGSDKLSPVQTMQDIACCRAKFPDLICRPVSAQFMEDGVIALFELIVEAERALIVEERHYRLVPSDQIDADTKRRDAVERLYKIRESTGCSSVLLAPDTLPWAKTIGLLSCSWILSTKKIAAFPS